MKRLNLGLGLCALLSASAVQAATTPYSNDFTSAGDALPNATLNQWSVNGGNYVNSFTAPSAANTATTSTTSDTITNLATSTSFTMSSKFSFSSLPTPPNTTGDTVGFGVLGTTATFGTAYLADWGVSGTGTGSGLNTVRLTALGDSSDVTSAAGSTLTSSFTAPAANTTYELRLTGTRTANLISLTLGVYDSAGVQIGTSATLTDTTPITGTYFGFRNRYNTASSTVPVTVSFDNLTIAVPEPASAAVMVGGSLLLRRRRRGV